MLKPRHYKGMSIVELMVGVAIIGILVTFSIPSYRAWIQNSKIRTSASSIQTGLQLARAEAIKRNQLIQMEFRGVNSAWTICTSPTPAGNCPNSDDSSTVQSRNVKEGGSADISVSASHAGPYVFNGLGMLITPSLPANSLLQLSVDVSTSVLPASESRELKVIVGRGGNSRLCDPNLSSSGTDPRRCP